ncbi:MAG TPA: serine/threonine-protein kinase [Actinophytocola sp.]|uniref:serine/threonine-protein kinase n=1 Tax=Actinophytocola sp. TaxID=1872138 RepID=UPI002DDC968E|nr:serine/threonine-protein kinase [Actinophytocola sp.]HEV2783406.1 serine/threonine-protein kinase [Actinophytocola sp.]
MIIKKGQLVAGRYRLVESVGSGGMGIVWRAEDERLERTVAIKQLLVRPGLSEEQAADTRRRAMREARTAARLQHRNAIALFDVAEHDGDPWLVMEFLRSRSLSTVLAERGALPATEVAKIGSQVASALAAAHAAGIVHRDVKPGNVLLDDDGLVKITDFGISRTLDDGTLTQTGMLAGTPAYLAPEVARGKQPERASDVFSLGATLYHAVEGTPPFGAEPNPLALLHAVASGKVPPPQRAGMLTPVLMSMLDADPAARPTMSEVTERLSALETVRLDEQRTIPVHPAQPAPTRTLPQPEPLPPAPARPAPPPSPPARAKRPGPRPKRIALIAALVAVFALAGIVTAIVLGSRQTAQQGANPPPSSEPATTSPSAAPPPTTSVVPVQGPIDWSSAGQLVIDYYGGLDNPQARWDMLSANGRAAFGDQQAFQQYWSQFKQVSSRNARGVTPNPDGSVNVPVDVTYTGADGAERQEHKVLRVTIDNGRLAIDSEAR